MITRLSRSPNGLWSTALSARRSLCCALTCLLVLCGSAEADWKTDIGYNALVTELQEKYAGVLTLPNGAGVKVSLAEADTVNDNPDVIHKYLPSSTESQLLGVNINNGSSVTTPQVSDHATAVARTFFGSTSSVAPGVTQATAYEANDFLNAKLRVNTNLEPIAPNYKVQNHSWVGSFDAESDTLEALRRLDYTIDTYDVIVPVGLSNTSTSKPYELLAQSYNSIGVGRTDGNHKVTQLASYGPGRIKPDIVAPGGTTSQATPMISSVATMLYQSATDTTNFPNADPDAAKSETMKAILMAGATKDEFPGWENAADQPLDLIYGAGEVNVRNSFFIQQGGQWDAATEAGGPAMGDYGWDYGDVVSGGSNFYELVVPRFYTGTELSVVLAWNVKITDSNSSSSVFAPIHSLANLDLRLYDSTGTPLETELAASVSTKDNVEHIYFKDLAEGNYTLEVRSVSDTPYRMSGDYNLDGIVDSADYSLWRDTFGSTVNPAADGDLSGVVDDGDYLLWRSAYGTVPQPPVFIDYGLAWRLDNQSAPSFAAAVSAPEPTTLMLLVSLLGGGLLARRRVR